jgi:hypothetical protein
MTTPYLQSTGFPHPWNLSTLTSPFGAGFCTHATGYSFRWVGVRVASEYPGVIRANHYSWVQVQVTHGCTRGEPYSPHPIQGMYHIITSH